MIGADVKEQDLFLGSRQGSTDRLSLSSRFPPTGRYALRERHRHPSPCPTLARRLRGRSQVSTPAPSESRL
jgi:hypothetical protein